MEAPSTVLAASLGIPDTLLLVLLALVVLGPRRLPEIGRQIGKLMYEFRKISHDFNFQMEQELRTSQEAEVQKKLQAATRGLTMEQDFPQKPDVAEKTGAPAHSEAIRITEREINHA